MTYYVITKDGEPTRHMSAVYMNVFVGVEFLKEMQPEHVWDIEEINMEDTDR